MENSQNTQQNNNVDEQSLDIREILSLVWRLRYWIAASAFVALCLGFLYVRMQAPVYQRSTTIMLNNESSSGGELSAIADLMGGGSKKRIDNEIFILKSASMMEKVVTELDLNTRYYHYAMPVADRINFGRSIFARKRVEYYHDNPFELEFKVDSLYPAEMQPASFSMEFKNMGEKGYKVKTLTLNGKKQELDSISFQYGQVIPLEGCTFSVTLTDETAMKERDRYLCSWSSPYNAAKDFAGKLKADIQAPVKTRQSDVVIVSMEDVKPGRAVDILNTLVIKVNDEARNYSNITTLNTIEFIDQRLVTIAKDLSDAENDFKSFQRSNTVVDLNAQSSISIETDRQYREQLNEVELQLQLLAMVTEYVNGDEQGKYSIIPANIGVSDAGLNSIITSYNTMVMERNRMVANSSESNPRVVSLNSQLNDQKQAIQMSVDNLVRMYNIRSRELQRMLSQGKTQMANIPEQQFEMQQLNRRLEIIEPLYQLLQQKREEAQIQMYAQMDNFRLIEPASGSRIPISPKSRQIYLLSFLLGCCIPLAVVWLRSQLRTKVESKKDVTDHIDANVLGVLPLAAEEGASLIQRNGRDAVSESFRSLRSNLQYFSGVKVIQVTSSIPGEGKTFVASNLALSLAHVGKKVLIVGMDIRKPRLNTIFKIDGVDMNNTLVGYLIGKCDNLDQLVCHSQESHHLDVMFAGPVPPNPTELLSQGREADVISHFRDQYDYIVVDSAPFMPVSDSFLINAYVDMTLYTVRIDHTPLALLNDIQTAIHDNNRPLNRVNIVINGLDLDSSKYRYGYGYGYGSGYGYGYGYGYGEEGGEDKKDSNRHHNLPDMFVRKKSRHGNESQHF